MVYVRRMRSSRKVGFALFTSAILAALVAASVGCSSARGPREPPSSKWISRVSGPCHSNSECTRDQTCIFYYGGCDETGVCAVIDPNCAKVTGARSYRTCSGELRFSGDCPAIEPYQP